MIFEKLFNEQLKSIPKIIRMLGTFLVVHLLWVLFRAESLPQALKVYQALFSFRSFDMDQFRDELGVNPIKLSIGAMSIEGMQLTYEQVISEKKANSIFVAIDIHVLTYANDDLQTYATHDIDQLGYWADTAVFDENIIIENYKNNLYGFDLPQATELDQRLKENADQFISIF